MEEAGKKTLSYLEKLCSMREYCRKDIFEKAFARTQDESLAAELVEKLVGEGYVDDLRYASAFARDKSVITGWGPVKISRALYLKKIPSDVVKMALTSIDADKAADKLDRALESRYRVLREDPSVRLKLIKFALSRGYEYDAVSKAVDRVLKSDSDGRR